MSLLENGNDNISSEEHFKNLKTKTGSYLLPEMVIIVQILTNSVSWPSPFKGTV